MTGQFGCIAPFEVSTWCFKSDLVILYIHFSNVLPHFVFFLCRMVIHRTLTAVVSRGWWRPITRASNLCVSTDPPTSPLLLTMWPGRSTIITARNLEHVGRHTKQMSWSTMAPRNLQFRRRNSCKINWLWWISSRVCVGCCMAICVAKGGD